MRTGAAAVGRASAAITRFRKPRSAGVFSTSTPNATGTTGGSCPLPALKWSTTGRKPHDRIRPPRHRGGADSGRDRRRMGRVRGPAVSSERGGVVAVSVWERLPALLQRDKAPEERPLVNYSPAFFERVRARYERAAQAVDLLESELADQPTRASDRVEQLLEELRSQRWAARENERLLNWESGRVLAYARIWNLQEPEVDENGWVR